MKWSDHIGLAGVARKVLVAICGCVALVNSAMGQVELESANLPGALPYVQEGRWSVARSIVVNTGDTSAEALVRVNAKPSNDVLFGSRVWLPPRSRRVINTPIRVTGGSATASNVTLQTVLVTEVDGQPRIEGPIEASVLQRGGPFNLLVVGGDEASEALDLLSELRSAAGLSPGIAGGVSSDLPWTVEGYEALDGLVIAERMPRMNDSQCEALIAWVRAGGRVWLMLNRVDPTWAASVFGDVLDLVVLGEDELNSFSLREDGSQSQWYQETDKACRLVHVVMGRGQTLQWVGGSPAATRLDCGKGEVLLSFLSPHGWLSGSSPRQAITPLMTFMEGKPVGRPDAAALMESFKPYVTQQMGYEVIARGWIALAFGVLVTVLLLAVILLHRWHRLEWVGPVGVVGGAGIAAVVVLGGMAGRSELSSKVLRAQLIEIEGGRARVTESVNVFRAAGDPVRAVTPEMTGGGLLLAAQDDTMPAVPVVWSDPQTSAMPNMELRADAARRFVTQSTVSMPTTSHALVRFDGAGAVVRVEGAHMSDTASPVLISPSGALALNPSAEGWSGGLSQVMLPGQFSASTFMGDADAARQEVLRSLTKTSTLIRSPKLACWIDPIDSPLQITGIDESDGVALALLPVQFVPGGAGGKATIPWPFVAMTPYRGKLDGRDYSTAIYDVDSHRWIAEVQQAMRVVMRFELPEGYQSMSVESLRLTVDVRAPGRSIDVFVVSGGRSRRVASISDALGRQSFEITGDDLPAASSDSAVVVGLDVGEFADPLKPRSWSLQGMELSVKGSLR